MQQLRTTRSTSSTLIDQCINDCRSIEDNLQTNIQRITEDFQTVFSTCNRSVGKFSRTIRTKNSLALRSKW